MKPVNSCGKLRHFETEFSRMQAERGGNQREPRAERPPRTPREPRFERPDSAEIERRAHHLEVAIDNLHAAGLHEPAERLAPQLERMRRHLEETRLASAWSTGVTRRSPRSTPRPNR